jgi:hypothetical protein
MHQKGATGQAATGPREGVQSLLTTFKHIPFRGHLTETNLPVLRSAAVHGADDGTQGSRPACQADTEKNFVRSRVAGL